jgi:hypothetical protein
MDRLEFHKECTCNAVFSSTVDIFCNGYLTGQRESCDCSDEESACLKAHTFVYHLIIISNNALETCKISGFHGSDCEGYRLLGCYAVLLF